MRHSELYPRLYPNQYLADSVFRTGWLVVVQMQARWHPTAAMYEYLPVSYLLTPNWRPANPSAGFPHPTHFAFGAFSFRTAPAEAIIAFIAALVIGRVSGEFTQ